MPFVRKRSARQWSVNLHASFESEGVTFPSANADGTWIVKPVKDADTDEVEARNKIGFIISRANAKACNCGTELVRRAPLNGRYRRSRLKADGRRCSSYRPFSRSNR